MKCRTEHYDLFQVAHKLRGLMHGMKIFLVGINNSIGANYSEEEIKRLKEGCAIMSGGLDEVLALIAEIECEIDKT